MDKPQVGLILLIQYFFGNFAGNFWQHFLTEFLQENVAGICTWRWAFLHKQWKNILSRFTLTIFIIQSGIQPEAWWTLLVLITQHQQLYVQIVCQQGQPGMYQHGERVSISGWSIAFRVVGKHVNQILRTWNVIPSKILVSLPKRHREC
jgi:hypothetical protein